jgi:hypothetical protein
MVCRVIPLGSPVPLPRYAQEAVDLPELGMLQSTKTSSTDGASKRSEVGPEMVDSSGRCRASVSDLFGGTAFSVIL